MDELERELQLIGDLVPHRQEPHRPRILKTKPTDLAALLDKGSHLSAKFSDPPIGPPRHRQFQIVVGIALAAAEQGQHPLVEIGDLGALPRLRGLVARRRRRCEFCRAVPDVHAERIQRPRA
ncbi:MAG: hypothetical protein JO213_19250 [Alphaproteobacteria bacterium]|nr:hypothetical protein [Alphaproteobacteria bacterium]MBV9965281.1 hypothetical protein [Alphaproteobacteria bacterium]